MEVVPLLGPNFLKVIYDNAKVFSQFAVAWSASVFFSGFDEEKMVISLDKLWRRGVIFCVNTQQSSNAIFEVAGWIDPTPEKNKAVSSYLGGLETFITHDALEGAPPLQQRFYRSLLGTPFLFLRHTFVRSAFEGE